MNTNDLIQIITDNESVPQIKSLTIPVLTKIAKKEKINIKDLKKKDEIYRKIRNALIESRGESSSTIEESVEPSSSVEPFQQPVKGKTPRSRRRVIEEESVDFIEQIQLDDKRRGKKEEISVSREEVPYEKNIDLIELYIQNSKLSVEEVLDLLEKAQYSQCNWLKDSNLRKIGSGAGGSAFLDSSQNKIYKAISYTDIPSYITVLFASKVNQLIKDGISDSFMEAYFINKCLASQNFKYPVDKFVIEVYDYVKGKTMSQFLFINQNNHKLIDSVVAQVYACILVMMFRKISHLDLHTDNIIVYESNDKTAVFSMGSQSIEIPLLGYKIKIIDYDRVGVIIKNKAYTSNFPIGNSIASLNAENIKKYPGFFMLAMFSRFLRSDIPARDYYWQSKIFCENSYLDKIYDVMSNVQRKTVSQEDLLAKTGKLISYRPGDIEIIVDSKLLYFHKSLFLGFKEYGNIYTQIYLDCLEIIKKMTIQLK
jgi:hypothetical protein